MEKSFKKNPPPLKSPPNTLKPASTPAVNFPWTLPPDYLHAQNLAGKDKARQIKQIRTGILSKSHIVKFPLEDL